MKTSRRFAIYGVVASLLLNLFVTVPALVIFAASSSVRLIVYEALAQRVGNPEIVFIGDSITRDGGLWGRRIGGPPFAVRNLAHAGLYVEQMRYQADWAVQMGAEKVFVMAGINDAAGPDPDPEDSFRAYVGILESLRAGGVEPVIQSTLYREDGSDSEFVTALNERLHRYARENGVAYLDLNRPLCEGERLNPEHSRDGTHLTEKAYRVWAREIREFLRDSG